MTAHAGMSLQQALTMARQLGCEVSYIHGTGEVKVRHRSQTRSLRVNVRRKCAPRIMVTFLRKLTDERGSRP